jgi:hypothetical protein
MPPRRRQRAEPLTEGWAGLPGELLAKVLEALQDYESWSLRISCQEHGVAFSAAAAPVRLVCAAWKAVHDMLVKQLVLRIDTTDQGMGLLVRAFPAATSLRIENNMTGEKAQWLTDKGVRAASQLRALTYLDLSYGVRILDEGLKSALRNRPALTNLNLSYCVNVGDKAMKAVSLIPTLTALNLGKCDDVTDKGVLVLSKNLTALTCLSLFGCYEVTDVGVRAVCDLPALTELDLSRGDEVTDKSMRAISNNLPLLRVLELWQCNRITDKGVRALSILPALNHLNLDDCARVTKAGVQALRGSTASPSLSISSLNSCPWP